MTTPAPTNPPAPATPPTTPPANPPANPAPTSPPTPTPAANGGATFTQEQVDAIIAERLARHTRTVDEKNAKAKADADAAALAEQGQFKQLAEQAQKKAADLEAAIAARDHRDLQREVAAAAKLPAELAERLRGTTREELAKDAADMAKLVTPVQAPAQPGNRPGPRPAAPGQDSAEKTETFLRQSGRYSAI